VIIYLNRETKNVKTILRYILLFIFIGFIFGCESKIKPVSAPVRLPEEFSETGSEALPETWWRAFKDEALNALIERALTDNFSLKTAWDRLAQAEAVAEKAGAALWPEANVSGSARRIREENGSEAFYYHQYSLGISVSYEADLWGRIRSSRQAALLEVDASQEDILATAILLSARIASVWYQLSEAQAQIEVIRKQIDTNEKVLTIITTQFRKGQAGAADVLRQRQFLESSRGQLIRAQEQAELLYNELAVLLGTAPGTIGTQTEAKLIEVPALPAISVPAELIQRRPDVRSAYLAVQAADQRVASAIADQFPRLSLSAGAETSGMEARDLFDNWLVNMAGNLTQPIFDGNRRKAEIKRTKAVLSQTIHQYGEQILLSLQEVEDALTQERRQSEYLTNLTVQLATSRQVVDRTRESYLKGQLEYIRVLDALASFQSLERNHLTAKRQLIERRIDLCRALAGGWEMNRPELASLQ
jgi:NodT family efflux transporter outer membrane factor (OMF) lipoprotein